MNKIEELTELFLDEFHRNPELRPEDFAARYPECENELADLLSTILLLESGKKDLTSNFPERSFPEKLTGFRIEKKIGQGGMGIVLRARQELLNRPVALKILPPGFASDSERRKSFENEARVVANLHHPNILQVFGAGYEAGFSFFVMELIEGAPPDCGRPHSEIETARIGCQTASALAYAHSCNVLHRDVKPGNILIDAQGCVHLGDFGLAAILPGKDSLTVTDHSREGTIRYMAPEIFLENHYSRASDQYAFGVTLYEFLTGKPALEGSSPGRMIRDVCERGIPRLSEKKSDLAVIINKCTAFRPRDRYSGMKEAEADLRRFLNSEPIQARRTGIFRRFRLWCGRNPLAASLSISTGSLLLILFVLSSGGCFMVSRTLKNEERMRRLAEENSLIARHALERIYKKDANAGRNVLSLPPSRAAAALLSDLLPCYEDFYRLNSGENPAFLSDLRKDLASLALRAGNYDVAEKMFRKAAEESAGKTEDRFFYLNRRALALSRSGRRDEAEQIWREVIREAADSMDSNALLEGVFALRSLTRMPDKAGHADAALRNAPLYEEGMKMLLRIEEPVRHTPEYQFLFASILIDAPDLATTFGIEEKPFDLLERLVRKYPANRDYRSELVRAALALDLGKKFLAENSERMEFSLSAAESLLAEGAADAALIDSAAALYEKYIDSIRNRRESVKQSNRIIGIMKLLATGRKNTENAKAAALRFLLKQYEFLARTGKPKQNNGAEELRAEIEEIISNYKGPGKDELERQFKEISEKLP